MKAPFTNSSSNKLRRCSAHLAVIATMSVIMLSLTPGDKHLRPASAASPIPMMQSSSFNYGEVLQKAIWFYEAQVSGQKPTANRVSWRGDSTLGDGSDVGVNLTGGWFDAGDHIKFGFAMASSAAMLAWGAVENRQAYVDSGQLPFLLNNLRVVNDYFIKAHSSANELWGQIGEEGPDHNFWGSAEILQAPRRAFKIDLTNGGSDLAAQTAAAMAASAVVFRPTDPAYANTLVAHARQLFAFAEATYHPNDFNTTGNGNFYVDAIPAARCCYNSRFGNPADEMTWAATWLFLATNETAFRDRARQLYPTMCKENGTQTPCFTWAQNWNDQHFGTYVLMAKITGEQQFRTDAERWLDFWSVGGGRRTAGGLMFVDGFGALRYATNTAFIALVYADFLGTSNPLYSRYHDFGKRQIDYALGANPANHSYVCGFGNNPPINPHHRTAHGSWVNGGPSGVPLNNRHVLFGALVGGPTAQDDFSWVDDRGNFRANEVATDFNAGFASAVARLFREFGGSPLPNFPPIEVPDGDEIFIEAGINVAGTNFTEIRAFVVNRSAWPARMLERGTFRYFFNLEPGVTPSQISVNNNFSQCGGGVTGPVQWSGNTYYVQINCLGTKIFPGGQSEHRREVQFRISSSGAWNPSDDHSFQGLAGVTGGQVVKTNRIVLYDNGVRIWGTEPGPANPDFSLSANPANLVIARGSTGTSAITITRTGGFANSVMLSATNLPNGVTAAFNPLSTTGTSSMLTLTASSTATLGTSTINVVGAGGSLTHSTPINLTVTNPDFSLSANPSNLAINRGTNGASTITITRTGGFNQPVAFTTGVLPAGVTASFNPQSTSGGSTVVTFTVSSTATLGTAPVTINGSGGGLTRTAQINLTVNPIQTPDFSLTVNPANVTVSRNANSASTITITRIAGFASSVTFSAAGLPMGVTAQFNPGTTTTTGTTSTVTFTASGSATLGTAPITITGSGGGISRTVQINLTVNDGGGGGVVTITPVINASGPYFNEEAIRLNNTATLTALTVTIVIQRTTGIGLNGQYNTVGGQIVQSTTVTTPTITYQFTLGPGQTLSPGNGRLFAAQTSGTGTVHPTAGDTFTVTFTSGGVTVTQTGTF